MNKKTEGDVARGLGQVAAASTGAAAGVAVGGPAGALVGAAVGPVLATGFEMAADRIAANRAARRGELMSEVTRALGIEVNDLQQRLLADERLLEFAGRVVGAAQDVSLTQKRRALSRALAAAIADPTPARLDIWELLQAAIREIDAPHIRFLHVISSAPSLPRPPEKPVDGVRYGMTLEQVCEIDPGLGLGGHAILQKLLSLGLIESSLHGVLWSGTHRPYALSGLGQRLMTLLESDGPSAS